MSPDQPQRAEIEFPFEWNGRVVATNSRVTLTSLRGALLAEGVDEPIRKGRQSATGRYATYRITITFEDRAQMDRILAALARTEGVKIVL